MKILRIILILLIPAFGFVGCQKSDIKPSCQHEDKSSKESDDNSQNNVGSRTVNSTGDFESGDDEGSTDIIGSGDDDRDGGDKKKKLSVK